MNSSYISPFAKPVYIMLKPIGSVCNLACEYCYYLEKSKFYPDVKNHIMTDQILRSSSRNTWNAKPCKKSCLHGMEARR